MVTFLENYFNNSGLLVNLNSASDRICNDNLKQYINFDKFIEKLHSEQVFKGERLASCDTILFNINEQHIIFVEFKDMEHISTDEELKKWWNCKYEDSKCKSRSVYLKITDTILGLSYYLKNKHSKSYDDFMETSKSFFYVYRSSSYKSKINNHLKYKFSRYNFLFKNIRVIECNNFENFLERHAL